MFIVFQIRRSFLEELGINKNWSVVDMIFREFYTGSDEDLSPSERGLLESMFSSQFYVEREIEYGYITTKGTVNKTALKNWKGYLKKYGKYILRGTHFTNFAVQVMYVPQTYFLGKFQHFQNMLRSTNLVYGLGGV